MDDKTPVAEAQTPPKKNKSAPQLYVEKIPTVEAVRRTQLVIQSTDFISLGDDVHSNQSAPHSVGTSDWEPFIGGSPAKEQPVEKSAGSWNAFENPPQLTMSSPDLLDSHSNPPVPTPDPFGLDALPHTPKVEASTSVTFIPPSSSMAEVSAGQQSTEDILKLYDVPKKTGEAPLPPNLGLPMGPQGMPVAYPPIAGQPYGMYPAMGTGLYPQIAVPNPNAGPGFGQSGAFFNAPEASPQQFYGQGHK